MFDQAVEHLNKLSFVEPVPEIIFKELVYAQGNLRAATFRARDSPPLLGIGLFVMIVGGTGYDLVVDVDLFVMIFGATENDLAVLSQFPHCAKFLGKIIESLELDWLGFGSGYGLAAFGTDAGVCRHRVSFFA
jgi:hypothetical protein